MPITLQAHNFAIIGLAGVLDSRNPTGEVQNRPPVIAAIPNQTATAGTTFSLASYFSDPDFDALTCVRTGGTAPIGVTISPQGLVAVAADATPGACTVALSVSDGRGGTASATFNLLIQAQGVNSPFRVVSPLELMSPRRSGSGGPPSLTTGLHAGHRIYYAYPGLEYNIRAQVRGGSYPYTFALSNAPAGMSVDSRGVISWPNPTASASNITLTVTDSLGNTASGTWSITVDTAGWVFVDANAAVNGTGTLASPFNSLLALRNGAGANTRAYFRGGTYYAVLNSGSLGAAGNHFGRMAFRSDNSPVVWLAYPGETPIIDQALSRDSNNSTVVGEVCLEFAQSSGDPPYIDGFRFTNILCKGVLIGGYGGAYPFVFRRCQFYNGGGHEGHNSGFISVRNGTTVNAKCGSTVQDCTFDLLTGATCALKLYSMDRAIIEDNVFSNTATDAEGCIAQKNNCPDITIRRNTALVGQNQPFFGGNLNYDAVALKCSGEICYNNVRDGWDNGAEWTDNTSLRWQTKINSRGPFTVYRNTINGNILVQTFDAADGLLTIEANVIVNDQGGQTPVPYVYDDAVTDVTRLAVSGNLTSATVTGVIDPATGLLTGASTTYRGTHGHEVP